MRQESKGEMGVGRGMMRIRQLSLAKADHKRDGQRQGPKVENT